MSNPSNTLVRDLLQARRLGVPLLSISTADPAQTESLVQNVCEKDPAALLSWNITTGLKPLNERGEQIFLALTNENDPMAFTGDTGLNLTIVSIDALEEEKIVVTLHNAHRHLDKDVTMQALWNARDTLSGRGSSLILLGPSFELPNEIQGDVLCLDDPLPTEEELQATVARLLEDAGLEPLDEATMSKATQALLGLSTFSAEQATALALSKKGLCLEKLWDRKRQAIAQTPGLSVLDERVSFDDIGGVAQVKTFLSRVIEGRNPPRAVVFIDEIEKAMAGSSTMQSGDSGVSADQLAQLLTFMEDNKAMGVLFVGHPGSAKSMVAKATGTTAGVPTITLDLGGTKSSLIGASEGNLRQSLRVISAVSGGQPLFVATCNNLTSLPPELRRRFKLGIFFFDLPDRDEAEQIWSLYRTKYNLEGDDFDDTACVEWTGAEISSCCEIAYNLNTSLSEAAQFIVPISKSAAERVATLRQEAKGRWLSASHPGPYTGIQQKSTTQKRRLKVN